MAKDDSLTVFITQTEATCDECGAELGRRAWITLVEPGRNALCLECADLDHLVFLPSGDAALTRRSRKHSGLSAVVVTWSRARRRYERQGLLVEEDALTLAEEECLADAEVRERRRQREAARRAELDRELVRDFARRIREMFPGCPSGTEGAIAEHACRRHSGRVGRTAAGRDLDAGAVRLAVVAHVRHRETNYDELLMGGVERYEARERVEDEVGEVLAGWERAPSPSSSG